MGKKSIKTNVILNMFRQICTGLFPVFTVPYISRILGANYYGQVNFSISIINYFVLFGNLGIVVYATRECAILRNNKQELNKFANEVFTTHILMTVLSLILLFVMLFFVDRLSNNMVILSILSIMLIFNTFNVEWLYNAYEDYWYPTICTIFVQVISFVLLFVFVHNSSDLILYCCVYVLSYSGMYILSFFGIGKYSHIHLTLHPNIIKHIVPMFILFSNDLMITIYVNSDITILGFLTNDSSVGIYSVSVKAYSICKKIFGAIITVMLPRLSSFYQTNKKDKYRSLVTKAFNAILLFVIPAAFGMFFISDDMMMLLGGKEYILGGNSLRVLCLALVFSALANFFTTAVMLPSRNEKKVLVITAISAIVNIGLNFMFIPWWGFIGAALTTLIAECIVATLSIFYSRKEIHIKIKLKTIISIVMEIICITMICTVIGYLELNYVLDVIAKVFLSMIACIVVLIISKNNLILDIVHSFNKRSQ